MPLLGVNIDHVATLRQARREYDPDPVKAALICQQAGADSIVAHLREDRRHINDSDVKRLRAELKIRFNLEMSINPKIVGIACRIQPDQATLVPERRQELTTEGGLDVVKNFKRLKSVCRHLSDEGICVSLFIDPIKAQLDAARELVAVIELHTGRYAETKTPVSLRRELKNLENMTAYGIKLGLTVNAGHGLKYHNTLSVAEIPGMHELNIGHSIMAHAMFVGLEAAVKEMVVLARTDKTS
ncbi:MAG: pyridoxine 5'-phosphate synthase [Candidatus Omnitrophica bacterium]|nr:pyridoxine 5'-phosphate synthase [Candidatus Omnitrophota bacterium]